MSDAIGDLRAWQRFHVRITTLYTLVVLVAITAFAVGVWKLVSDALFADLQERMLVEVQLYAEGVDPERLDDPAYAPVLHERFSRVPDPAVDTIYVLKGDDPAELTFVVDWAGDGSNASPGDPYDASELPVLIEGFERPSVEDQLYEDEWGLSLSAYTPVGDAMLGIDVDASYVYALRRSVFGLTLVAWLVSVAMIGVASILVGRNVRDPLSRVIDATASVAAGAFDTRLKLDRDDEFGLMAIHFDRMAEGLAERERIRETFGRYVAPDVARTLLADGAHLGGEKVEVTVLFSDIRGFSTISEKVDPKTLIELTNRYLAAMQTAINAEEGTVIEFLGDAIMAVFGAPRPVPDHAVRATRCAIAMCEALDELNEEGGQELKDLLGLAGFDRLEHRIGVHTGPALAGNIGSDTRMKYTVVGDTVNIAARLEQMNKDHGTRILISGTTAAAVDVPLTRRGDTPVKGREEPVDVYAIGA